MQVYQKIVKNKGITYYLCANQYNSKTYFILCDFSKSKYAESGVLNGDTYEVCVAWVDRKSKDITWKEDTENMIDKDIIRNAVVFMV
jgi:hypothetical protein